MQRSYSLPPTTLEENTMGNVKKSARVSDQDIKRLNHAGLSLKAIADKLGCHAATITLRLKAMGIKPSDTRRSFMEQVFMGLSTEEQDQLTHYLFNQDISIKDYVTSLIKENVKGLPVQALPPEPELQATQAAAEDVQPAIPAVAAEPVAEPEAAMESASEATPEVIEEVVEETASPVPAENKPSIFG